MTTKRFEQDSDRDSCEQTEVPSSAEDGGTEEEEEEEEEKEQDLELELESTQCAPSLATTKRRTDNAPTYLYVRVWTGTRTEDPRPNRKKQIHMLDASTMKPGMTRDLHSRDAGYSRDDGIFAFALLCADRCEADGVEAVFKRHLYANCSKGKRLHHFQPIVEYVDVHKLRECMGMGGGSGRQEEPTIGDVYAASEVLANRLLAFATHLRGPGAKAAKSVMETYENRPALTLMRLARLEGVRIVPAVDLRSFRPLRAKASRALHEGGPPRGRLPNVIGMERKAQTLKAHTRAWALRLAGATSANMKAMFATELASERAPVTKPLKALIHAQELMEAVLSAEQNRALNAIPTDKENARIEMETRHICDAVSRVRAKYSEDHIFRLSDSLFDRKKVRKEFKWFAKALEVAFDVEVVRINHRKGSPGYKSATISSWNARELVRLGQDDGPVGAAGAVGSASA